MHELNGKDVGKATLQQRCNVAALSKLITPLTNEMTVYIMLRFIKKQKREKRQTQTLRANHLKKPNSRNLARQGASVNCTVSVNCVLSLLPEVPV